jgi:hypothetical protein
MSRSAHSPRFCWLLALALLGALAPRLHAQIDVSIEIDRRLFVCYEPIIATVDITNLTGRDLTLEDKEPNKWFGFEIFNDQGVSIPPLAVDYHLAPLTIPMGQTVKRKVNLVSLFPITEYGVYHVRAVVYSDTLNQYFGSGGKAIEISDGTTVWQQTVGIPDGSLNAGQYRSYELLTFHQPNANMLYVRIKDNDAGKVYATLPLGRLVDGFDPEVQVDSLSQLHILQMIAPKEFLYTRLGPNAEMLGQQDFLPLRTWPHLKRLADGDVTVTGGMELQPQAPDQMIVGPKLSDHPAGLPDTP